MRGASFWRLPTLLFGLSACTEAAEVTFAKNLFVGERALINMHLFVGLIRDEAAAAA